MNAHTRKIFVMDMAYPVVERSGYIKADLLGRGGWRSVWVDSSLPDPYALLVRRINQARRGGQ